MYTKIAFRVSKGVVAALIFIAGLILSEKSYSQVITALDLFKEEFQQKQTAYWLQKSNQLFSEMACKEKVLLQLIENIKEELRARSKSAVLKDNLGFGLLFSDPQKLLQSYASELTRLLEIHTEAERLRQIDAKDNYALWQQEFELLKRMVSNSFEDRVLFASMPENTHLIKLIQDYNNELDFLLTVYKKLENLEKIAAYEASDLVADLSNQKQDIVRILEDPGLEQVEALIEEYFVEIMKIVAVLDELSKLHRSVSDMEAVHKIEVVQRSILQNLDDRILTLIGYTEYSPSGGPGISEFFKEWKALQFAEYLKDLTKYGIIKKSLLASGTPEQRSRMQARDLEDALVNYSTGDYKLAEIQLNAILRDYTDYSNDLDVVYFYRAESNFARLLYDEAVDDYTAVIENYQDSQFMDESLFRLMQVSERKGETIAFYNYYNMFQSLLFFNEKLANDCHYFAGYVFLKNARFDDAKKALALIPEESEHYAKARYLQGIIRANEDDYEGAIAIYEDLSENGDIEIRDNALVQLGYLNYELGYYEKALEHFSHISSEYGKFDRVLLAAAWINFNQKNYDKTIEYVNHLVENYGNSETSYEALVLSAHNKKLLNQNDQASRDLSFVSNSRKALDLSKRYYAERDLIVSQLNDLDRLEEEVVEQKDRSMYGFIAGLRQKLEHSLQRFEFHGTADGIMYEELEKEKRAILGQIDKLEHIIAEAHASGNVDIANQAAAQRTRLVKALEVYQEKPFPIDYFSDYPLAVNEGATRYRKEVQSKLLKESLQENQKLAHTLRDIQTIRNQLTNTEKHRSIKTELTVLETQIDELCIQINQVYSWFYENQVELLETDFNHSADFSGFGLSNRTFAEIDNRNEEISNLSRNISYINALIDERKGEIERRIQQVQMEMERLVKENQNEKLQAEKQEKEDYFKRKYFDESEREKLESEPAKKKDGNKEN